MSAVFLDLIERILQANSTRLVLSFLIVLSLLPHPTLSGVLPAFVVSHLDEILLVLFAPEFVLRAVTWMRRRRRRRARAWEPFLLAADLVALVSFLPLESAVHDLVYLRLFRLTRMVLLLGYWGEMASDLWTILSGRERRRHVVLVLLLGLMIALSGALILGEFASEYDYDQDGVVDADDRAFHRVLWWSFRQLPDPGNLAVAPTDALVVGVSVLLTFAGLLLFSFIIGISSGAMDELMGRARERPVGLRRHTVILGLGTHSVFLLEELAEIYRKNRKRVRGAVLGPTREPPEYFHLRGLPYAYRHGDPVRVEDLDRVDVDQAKRVIVEGGDVDEPDMQVISATLAARARNPSASLYPDLEHEKNFHAARAAGGARTQIVGSGPFVGYYIAQNVIYPGSQRALRQLLTTTGAEIYTYVFGEDERRRLIQKHPGGLDPTALFAHAHLQHGVTLIGTFLAGAGESVEGMHVVLNPIANVVKERWSAAFAPSGTLRADRMGGVIGVARCWEDLRGCALAILHEAPSAPPLSTRGAFYGVDLAVPADRAERVLICGASPRVPRVLAELLQYYGPLEVSILVRETAHLQALAPALRSALEGFLSGLPRGRPPEWTVIEADGSGPLRVEGPRGTATIRIAQADWSDSSVLLRHPYVDLPETDVVLFLPREGGEEADGRVALDSLRLAHFAASGVMTFRPGFRVLGLVRDPVKSDLLERRLDQMSGAGLEARFTVISSERIRHQFMVQNVFVRGLSSIYLELLGGFGQHLCRLVPPADRAGDFDAWDLVGHLVRQFGLLPLGLEVERNGARDVILDARRFAPGQRFAWAEVTAIYAIGEGHAHRGA